MTSNKCLQIVILSYNRSKSLKDQINEFERLGYFSNPRVDFVIQDNNSDDDTEIVLDSVRQLGLGIRRFENNVGYARSYLKAHELCDFEYLWIVGDDLPAINALTLLLYIDGFQQDLISTLEIIKKAVEAGELDQQIEQVSGALRSNFKS